MKTHNLNSNFFFSLKKGNKNKRIYCAKLEVNLCISALGGRVQVRSRQMKTSTSQLRNKTHLPNRNVLPEIGRTNKHLRARGSTDDGHIRADARWSGQGTWWAAGEMGREHVSEWRVSLWEQRTIKSSIRARSQAKRAREGGWGNHWGGVKRNKIKSDPNNLIHTGNHWLNKPQCWLQ